MTELPSAGRHESGSGSNDLYAVEIRNNSSIPTTVTLANGNTFVIDNYWRRVPYRVNSALESLMPANYSERLSRTHGLGLFSYNNAQAIRFFFLSELQAEKFGAFCIETRLVKIRVHYTFKSEELGISEPVDSLEDNRIVWLPKREAKE